MPNLICTSHSTRKFLCGQWKFDDLCLVIYLSSTAHFADQQSTSCCLLSAASFLSLCGQVHSRFGRQWMDHLGRGRGPGRGREACQLVEKVNQPPRCLPRFSCSPYPGNLPCICVFFGLADIFVFPNLARCVLSSSNTVLLQPPISELWGS